MLNWTKETPLIGTEGLSKCLHLTSNTECWCIQPLSEGMEGSMSDGVLDLIDRASSRSPQTDSFAQVGAPIRKIVEGLFTQ